MPILYILNIVFFSCLPKSLFLKSKMSFLCPTRLFKAAYSVDVKQDIRVRSSFCLTRYDPRQIYQRRTISPTQPTAFSLRYATIGMGNVYWLGIIKLQKYRSVVFVLLSPILCDIRLFVGRKYGLTLFYMPPKISIDCLPTLRAPISQDVACFINISCPLVNAT